MQPPSTLRLIAPVGEIPSKNLCFYWEPLPEATGYSFELLNGEQVLWSEETSATEASWPEPLGDPIRYKQLVWRVTAKIEKGDVTAQAPFKTFQVESGALELPSHIRINSLMQNMLASVIVAFRRNLALQIATPLAGVMVVSTVLLVRTSAPPPELRLRGAPGADSEVVRLIGPREEEPSLRPVFAWEGPQEAKTYIFILSDSELRPLYTTTTSGTEVAYPENLPSLEPGKTYFWEVSWGGGTQPRRRLASFTVVGMAEE